MNPSFRVKFTRSIWQIPLVGLERDYVTVPSMVSVEDSSILSLDYVLWLIDFKRLHRPRWISQYSKGLLPAISTTTVERQQSRRYWTSVKIRCFCNDSCCCIANEIYGRQQFNWGQDGIVSHARSCAWSISIVMAMRRNSQMPLAQSTVSKVHIHYEGVGEFHEIHT